MCKADVMILQQRIRHAVDRPSAVQSSPTLFRPVSVGGMGTGSISAVGVCLAHLWLEHMSLIYAAPYPACFAPG